jgi:hypothetical protein
MIAIIARSCSTWRGARVSAAGGRPAPDRHRRRVRRRQDHHGAVGQIEPLSTDIPLVDCDAGQRESSKLVLITLVRYLTRLSDPSAAEETVP